MRKSDARIRIDAFWFRYCDPNCTSMLVKYASPVSGMNIPYLIVRGVLNLP